MRIPKHILKFCKKHTEELNLLMFLEAKLLGEGSYRKAFRVGGWVVKRSEHPTFRGKNWESRRRLVEHSLHTIPAPTVTVNGWDIQRFYRSPTTKQLKTWINWQSEWFLNNTDVRDGNIGVDNRGRMFAFDW